VFETKVIRRIFGPKKDRVIGQWRRLHNEELYMYSHEIILRQSNQEEQDGGWVGGHGLD
jgi:hypothetical protein